MRIAVLFATLIASLPLVAADFSGRFDELKAAATPAQLYALLYNLPKGGDLHNHSGGSERPEWIYAACTDPARNGGDTFYARVRFGDSTVAPPDRYRTIRQHTYDRLSAELKKEYVRFEDFTAAEREDWASSLRLDRPGEGRNEFFNVIWPRRGQLDENLAVKTEMLVENLKAFGAEHLSYLETQFGADGLAANDGRPIPADEAVAFVKARLARPDIAATGMTVRFQRTILRFAPDAERRLADAYAFVDTHRDLWVAINLAGIESNPAGAPARFLDTFRSLRARYPALALSIHAGEMDGADSHVRDTLRLGASRIGHGTNLINDPATLLLLQQTRRVLVEVSLISNFVLEYTPNLAKHPFPEYLRTGVPVCLNTDDRGMWDATMTDEYMTAVKTFNLSWAEVVELGRNSLAYSFVQPEVKSRLLADYSARVTAFEEKYGDGTTADALAKLTAVKPISYGYANRAWHLEFK